MKIHIPEFKAMAKCNAHLDHAAFDLEISDEELSKAGYEKVVRCKECIHHNKPPCPMRLSLNWTEDNDFCSYGERRESE